MKNKSKKPRQFQSYCPYREHVPLKQHRRVENYPPLSKNSAKRNRCYSQSQIHSPKKLSIAKIWYYNRIANVFPLIKAETHLNVSS